jgi:signal transduction histidine kinase
MQHAAVEKEVAGRVTHELATYVFHELRNDTNAAVGVLECLVEAVNGGSASLTRELQQMVFESCIHARHASLVITNVLDFAKLRAGAYRTHAAQSGSGCTPRRPKRLWLHTLSDHAPRAQACSS